MRHLVDHQFISGNHLEHLFQEEKSSNKVLFEEKVRTMYSAFYDRILTKNRKAIRKTTAKTTGIKGKKTRFH